MGNFLFFEDIRNFLTEAEINNLQKKLNVRVKAFWSKKINPKFRANATNGEKQEKYILKRTLNVWFNEIPAEQVDYIAQKVAGKEPNKEIKNEDGTYNFAYNCVDIENDAVVNAIFDYFRNQGYNVPDAATLTKNIPDEADLSAAEEKSQEKWMELVSELGNGQTNELVEKYIQMFSKIYQYVYGHKLSFRNAQLILSQKPNASLVLTEDDWMRFFKCKVNPGAQKILYWGRISDRHLKTFDDAQRRADSKGITYNKQQTEFRGHATLGLQIDDAESNGFCPVYGYDSSDVTPIDPNNDLREKWYGMKNNLTGEPNEITADLLKTLNPNDENNAEYQEIRKLINNNAKLYFKTLIPVLQQRNEQLANRFLQAEKQNMDYGKLLPKLIRQIVDKRVEEEYKIPNPQKRVTERERISGEILYLCGVWDANALQAVKGGQITKENLVHDSNIINEILTILDKGTRSQLQKLKTLIGNANIPARNPEQTAMNEETMNEQTFCTPEKLAHDLELQVVDSDRMSDDDFNVKNKENQDAVYEMLDRIMKIYK